MKIVHIELPRMFTLSVKEFLTGAAALLQNAGHDFQQFDINPNFWKWLLGLSTPHSPRDLYLPLLDAGGDPDSFWPLLAETSAHLNDVSRLYGVPLALRGIGLPPAVLNSSYAMCSLVADNFGCGLFSNFFQQLNNRLRFSDADLITLGLESPEGVFWALQLAAWLKSADSPAHICIARHAWENFTLIHHLEDLAKNPWFFGIIDSVILYQEELPETLFALAQRLQISESSPPGAPEISVENIAIKTAAGVQIHPPPAEKKTQLRLARPGYSIPPDYFSAMDTPPEHLVYCMAMVRNKCFYKKCTFCVQIAKHVSDRAYDEAAEIARTLNALEELSRRGITMVNFMDEAMRPVDLQKFCDGIAERKIRMHWVGRMIAAARPNRPLLDAMKRAGCIEILFGLETFDPVLAADMGKISRLHEDSAETSAMIEAFLGTGLFLILSMIYEFPTERPDSRRQTIASMERLQSRSGRFAMIFNRFHLLHVSEIYRDPARFNIAAIEPPVPENDLQYHFGYSCKMPHPRATPEELAAMHRLSLGLPENQYAAQLQRRGKPLLDMAYFLDYISIGFRHRAQKDATLFSAVLPPQACP